MFPFQLVCNLEVPLLFSVILCVCDSCLYSALDITSEAKISFDAKVRLCCNVVGCFRVPASSTFCVLQTSSVNGWKLVPPPPCKGGTQFSRLTLHKHCNTPIRCWQIYRFVYHGVLYEVLNGLLQLAIVLAQLFSLF